MVKALIFDYFGVVRPVGHGIRPTYRRLGGDLTTDEAFIADLTVSAGYGFVTDMDQQIADRLGVSLEVWRQAVAGASNNDMDLLAFIEQLHQTHEFKTGLLSNAGPGTLTQYFDSGEIERCFDAAIVSGDTGLAKPEGAFYRLIAGRLGVEPHECIMVDDNVEFCKGAEYIGMKSIHYSHFDQFKKELALLVN